jgi:hypothetical protein
MCARLDDAPTNVALLKQPLSGDLIKPVDHTRLRADPLAPNLNGYADAVDSAEAVRMSLAT